MGHPLNGRGYKLHVGVDDPVRVHVGPLYGLPDLALQALGPSPGDGELELEFYHIFIIRDSFGNLRT